jgi:hypothetical protein
MVLEARDQTGQGFHDCVLPTVRLSHNHRFRVELQSLGGRPKQLIVTSFSVSLLCLDPFLYAM